MKKYLLMLIVSLVSLDICSQTAYGWDVHYKTMQVGETFTLNHTIIANSGSGRSIDATGLSPALAFEYIQTSPNSYTTYITVNMQAAYPGTGILMKDDQPYYIIRVVEVESVDIPDYVEIEVGESYLFTPVTVPYSATTNFRWGSTNASVATATVEGNNYRITGLEPGYTQIYCSAVTNDNSTQSVVRVKPLLVKEVTINESECEMSIGDNLQMSATVSPVNATSTNVKWISANENIVQVNDTGNITAIAPGYCSVYAIADDGSGKYGKCMVHVLGASASRGDVNGDNQVTAQDASLILQHVAKKIVLE